MAADIAEQPEGYARLLDGEPAKAIAAVAARVAERRPRHVVFVGRGTSDHAALYAAYLTEIRLGVPVGLRAGSRQGNFRPRDPATKVPSYAERSADCVPVGLVVLDAALHAPGQHFARAPPGPGTALRTRTGNLRTRSAA